MFGPTERYEYFSKIPREDATPGQIGFLCYYGQSDKGVMDIARIARIFTATVLDLVIKKYIDLEIDHEKSDDSNEKVIFRINSSEGKEKLKLTEERIYRLLAEITKEKGYFTLDSLKKDISEKYTYIYLNLCGLFEMAKKEQAEVKNYDKEKGYTSLKYYKMFIWNLILSGIEFVIIPVISFSMIPFLIPAFIVDLYNMISIVKFAVISDGLLQQGIDEKEKLRALKEYMSVFASLQNEIEVPKIEQLEKYLVFATTMGCEDKFLEQLKAVYPNLETNPELLDFLMLSFMTKGNVCLSTISEMKRLIGKAYAMGSPNRNIRQSYWEK